MKSRSGLNAYQAPKPATIRTSRATFNLLDIIQILLFRFRNQLLVEAAGKSLQADFKRRQLGRTGVFQQSFRWHVTSSSSGSEEGECICETTRLPATVSVSPGCDEVTPRDSWA